MVIKVNGERRELPGQAASLTEVLPAVGIDPEQTGIAVALNMEVVPRSLWAETQVHENDELEVIAARQGG